MFPIYDDVNKITIWWSAKCGCSTVKNIYYNIIKNMNIPFKNCHFEYSKFIPEKLYYKNILITRNPYHRIVSCFLDKYIYGDYKCNIPHDNINFEDFINELYKKYIIHKYNGEFDNRIIDKHHTTPQFSEIYNDLLNYCYKNNINFKFDKIYKLEEFNYENQIDFIKNFRNDCDNDNDNDILSKLNYEIIINNRNNIKDDKKIIINYSLNYYLLKYNELMEIQYIKKDYNLFYNNSIKTLVEQIYDIDFKILKAMLES